MARVMGFGAEGSALLPTVDQYGAFKQRQKEVLQQHQQYAQMLEKKQMDVNARGGDLDIANRLYKILDGRISKPARQFLSKELATHLGVDPKTQQFKDVSNMLNGLDPDTLQSLRQQFATTLSGASPGQIAQTVKGIMTGQIQMNQFVDQMGSQAFQTGQGGEGVGEKTSEQLPQEEPAAIGGGGAGAAPAPQAAPAETQAPAPRTVAQPFGTGSNAIKSFEGARHTPPDQGPASPTIVAALGLDSTKRYRTSDLIAQGYRIPFDVKEQDKVAESINLRSTGISATIYESSQLVKMFEGKPETLGPVGGAVRTIQSTVRQVEGVLNMLRPNFQSEVDVSDPTIQGPAARAARAVAKLHGLDATAETSAQIQSAVLSLAYRMAIAQDIPGNRLTNAIISQNLTMIGQSASPEQFRGVLKKTIAGVTREFDEHMRRTVGQSGHDTITRGLSKADIIQMSQSPDLLPDDFKASLVEETKRRVNGEKVATPEPASPTLDEEEATIGRQEVETKQKKIEQIDQGMDLEVKRDQRQVAAQQRLDEREARVAAAQTDSQTLARERFDYQKQQDIQQADQQRQDKIGAAFRAFGNAIASSRGGGGGSVSVGNLGGGQDVSAFRMNPPPQRTPPRPGGSR